MTQELRGWYRVEDLPRRDRAEDKGGGQEDDSKKTTRKRAEVDSIEPAGVPPSIPVTSMADRSPDFAGRTVYFVDVRFMNGDRLLKEMQRAFAKRYPKVRTEFRQKRGGYAEDDPPLWTEIKKIGALWSWP